MDVPEPMVLPEDRLRRADEVAYFLGVLLQTLYTWKWENRGPACRKVGSGCVIGQMTSVPGLIVARPLVVTRERSSSADR
jgi:hypothetical protein